MQSPQQSAGQQPANSSGPSSSGPSSSGPSSSGPSSSGPSNSDDDDRDGPGKGNRARSAARPEDVRHEGPPATVQEWLKRLTAPSHHHHNGDHKGDHKRDSEPTTQARGQPDLSKPATVTVPVVVTAPAAKAPSAAATAAATAVAKSQNAYAYAPIPALAKFSPNELLVLDISTQNLARLIDRGFKVGPSLPITLLGGPVLRLQVPPGMDAPAGRRQI